MTSDDRQAVEDEFEAVRAPGLMIAEAAKRFALASSHLEWALQMTDPATADERVNFNQAYADQELDRHTPAWRESREDLRHALEQNAERIR